MKDSDREYILALVHDKSLVAPVLDYTIAYNASIKVLQDLLNISEHQAELEVKKLTQATQNELLADDEFEETVDIAYDILKHTIQQARRGDHTAFKLQEIFAKAGIDCRVTYITPKDEDDDDGEDAGRDSD